MITTHPTRQVLGGAACSLLLAMVATWPTHAGAAPAHAAAAPAHAAAQASTQCAPTAQRRSFATDAPSSDIDGDAVPDLVVGVPDVGTGSAEHGEVDVHGSRSGAVAVSGAQFPSLATSASFGHAIAELDVNDDSCEDLAVGDPGHTAGGAVDLLFGSSSGIRTDVSAQVLARTPSDEFGDSAAMDHRQVAGALITDLWVGAPGRTVNGLTDAGAVDHFVIDASGHPTYVESITEASPAVHSTPHAGDRFGAVLDAHSITQTPNWGGGVMIGTPDATVAGHADAGSISWVVAYGAGPAVSAGQTFSQDTAGVPGVAETGDRFGDALSGYDVGVPDEDLGTIRDAGLAQFFSLDTSNDLLVPGQAWTQNSAGVPGTAEAGDRFGASLFAADEDVAPGEPDVPLDRTIFIGSPGEDLATAVDAGDVTVIDFAGDNALPNVYLLRQGRPELGGALESGDEVGSTLSGVFTLADGAMANAVVGVPGEDLGSVADAGMITLAPTGFSVTYSGGATSSLRYGTVIAREGDG